MVGRFRKYARRALLADRRGLRCIAILTECSFAYVDQHLDLADLAEGCGLPIRPIRWHDVLKAMEHARSVSGVQERRLLGELRSYLGGAISMRRPDTNWVYVVSLELRTRPNWKISLAHVVEEKIVFPPIQKPLAKGTSNVHGF